MAELQKFSDFNNPFFLHCYPGICLECGLSGDLEVGTAEHMEKLFAALRRSQVATVGELLGCRHGIPRKLALPVDDTSALRLASRLVVQCEGQPIAGS